MIRTCWRFLRGEAWIKMSRINFLTRKCIFPVILIDLREKEIKVLGRDKAFRVLKIYEKMWP